MEKMQPMLFTTVKEYDAKQFTKDVIAGGIVPIIALPLSIALALASGVNPEQGIYTAIIAGLVISFFGGSSVQVSGPTAALQPLLQASWPETVWKAWQWQQYWPVSFSSSWVYAALAILSNLFLLQLQQALLQV